MSQTQSQTQSQSSAPDASDGKRAGAFGSIAAFVVGFAPWIVYWILVGNVEFVTAVTVPLAISVVVNGLALVRHRPLMLLDVGTTLVFVVFLILALTLSDNTLERWLQPLGNLGLFVVVLGSIVVRKPFTLQYAEQSTPPEMGNEPGFLYVCWFLAWVWLATMGFMTVVAAIPPIVDGDATILDSTDPLSIVCYWVLPYVALAVAMIFTSKFPDWFAEAAGGPPASTAAPAAPLAAIGPRATGTGRDGRALTLAIDPDDVLADTATTVRVTGVPAGASVAVAAETVDALGRRWQSTAECVAASDGTVDLSTVAPTKGTWTTADANGFVWSMEFASKDQTPDIFIPSLDPAVTVVSAATDGVELRATLVRRPTDATVTVHDVRAPGLVGRLFAPEPVGRHPAVVLFPGSEGGLDSQGSNAALLAAHGCVALVAATFSGDGNPPVEGLPTKLERVPLERYGDAIRWLAGHELVDPARVTAMSISRGSEGLLAAASRMGDLPLRQIIAVSPSSLTWVALGETGSEPGVPAWTFQGQDLPAVDTDDKALMAEIRQSALRRRGKAAGHGPALLHMMRAYGPRIDDPAATGAAAIESERITAPLLLVAGGADEMWPSTTMAQRLLDRRRQASSAAAGQDELLTYPGSGHLIRLGCWPTTVAFTSGIDLGGTATGLAAAQADVTPRIVAAATA